MNKPHSPVPPKKKVETGMSFPDAMKLLCSGQKIRRSEWADETEHGLLKDSFVMIFRNGKHHTWILSEGDVLATDWVVTK